MAERKDNRSLSVLPEGSQRTSGKDALSMNITAGKAVAEAVRTTLGPKGMDKMLVDSTGDVIITNDGATILTDIDVEHPAGTMIVEVAEAMDAKVGDGTTSAVVLAGTLLKEAESRLEEGIHPTTLAHGYRHAAEHAIATLEDVATTVDFDDRAALENIARTAMTGKGAEGARDHLAGIIVGALQAVADEQGIDPDHIKIETVPEGAIDSSELIDGIALDEEPAHGAMPTTKEDAAIAVLDTPLEVSETEIDAEVTVSDPDHLIEFLDQEASQVQELVGALADAGVDVVFSERSIDPVAQDFLADEAILGIERIPADDIERLSRATGANVVSNATDIRESYLGSADTVKQRRIGDNDFIVVEGVDEAKAVSLLLRGGTEHVVEEVNRAVEDALGVVRATIEDGAVLPGGGGPEIATSLALEAYADTISGREQLAIQSFADALDVVPRTLAENAGIHPIDGIVELRSQQVAGEGIVGIDREGRVRDVSNDGVVEPLRVKTQAILSATEAVVMILRIDEVITAGSLAEDDEEQDLADVF